MVELAKEVDIYDIQFVTWEKIKSRFSKELNEYIATREEQIKTEPADDKIITSTSLYGSFAGHLHSAPIIQQRSGRYDDAIQCLLNSMSISSISSSFATITPEPISQPLTREQELRREIQIVKTEIRRARNGLEITNLNRRLGGLERALRECRLTRNN